jgi:hypothetical protein
VQAKARVAIHLPSLAIEAFKMQFDDPRKVEVGRKVMLGVGPQGHLFQINEPLA